MVCPWCNGKKKTLVSMHLTVGDLKKGDHVLYNGVDGINSKLAETSQMIMFYED